MTAFVIRGEPALLVLHHHRLPLGAEHDLVLRVLEVGHVDLVVAATDGEQRGFVHEVREVGARHARRAARERRDVDVVGDRLVAQVDLENALAAPEIRRVDDDLPVEAARTQQRRIEHVGTVRRGDEDHAVVRLEAVHLDEQLVERLLALVVTAAKAGAAMAADGVDLVDEDDARRVCLALLEQIAHAARADADEHLDEVGTRHREERTAGLAGDRLREQRLAGARRTDEQRALRQTSAELGELLRIAQELDDLLQLLLRFVGAGDVGERDLRRVAREQLRLRLAERERLRAARLHLLEQEQVEADEQQPRHEVEDPRRDRDAGVLRVDLHALARSASRPRLPNSRPGSRTREVLDVLSADDPDALLERAVHRLAGRDRHL